MRVASAENARLAQVAASVRSTDSTRDIMMSCRGKVCAVSFLYARGQADFEARHVVHVLVCYLRTQTMCTPWRGPRGAGGMRRAKRNGRSAARVNHDVGSLPHCRPKVGKCLSIRIFGTSTLVPGYYLEVLVLEYSTAGSSSCAAAARAVALREPHVFTLPSPHISRHRCQRSRATLSLKNSTKAQDLYASPL